MDDLLGYAVMMLHELTGRPGVATMTLLLAHKNASPQCLAFEPSGLKAIAVI
jgi:hypothetical protein